MAAISDSDSQWWECQRKTGVCSMCEAPCVHTQLRTSPRAAQGLSPARIDLRGKFTWRIGLRVQRKGCLCAHLPQKMSLLPGQGSETEKKRFLCDTPLPLIFLQVLGTWGCLWYEMKIKMEFLSLQSLSCRARATWCWLGPQFMSISSSSRWRNSHFLWEIPSGASITKPRWDQVTPWEISGGEKARAGMLQSWNVLSPPGRAFTPRDPLKGSSSLVKLNNLDLAMSKSSHCLGAW